MLTSNNVDTNQLFILQHMHKCLYLKYTNCWRTNTKWWWL